MSVTTTGPVNLNQLIAELVANGVAPGFSLNIVGSPAAAGAVISSPTVTDAQITTALADITYVAPNALYAKVLGQVPANISFLAVAVPTTAQIQAQLAALTRQVNALTYQLNGQPFSTSGT